MYPATDLEGAPPTNHDTWEVMVGAAREWRRVPSLAAVALGALVVEAVFSIAFAYSLKAIVDDVTQHKPASKLAVVVVVLLVGFAVTALATVAGERAAARAAARIINGVRGQLYSHLLRLSPAFFLTTPAGKILNRFANNLKSLEGGYVQGFLDTVVLCISTVITAPLLFWLDWRLALIACATLPLVALAVNHVLPRSMNANDDLSTADINIVNAVQDTIRAQQVMRTFHLEGLLTERFDDLLAAQEQRSVHARGVAATIGKGASLGALFVQVMVIVVGAELAAHRVITIGTLVAFLTVLALAAKNVYDFVKTDLLLLAEAGRGAKGLDELLGAPVVVSDPEHGNELPPMAGTVVLSNVSFSYTPGKPALTHVTFEVPARTSVALVGANGSGKSTVLSLVMRFYDPDDGAILVDGHDLREVTQQSFRSQMGVVLQGNFIFSDTVRENIRIGNPTATDEEVVGAARRAELHDYVMSLPEGYDTPVGESGGRLSGGQRQRLAIARAMIRDSRVLLLDEVTTALDPATEASVNEMVKRVGAGRTVIAVTHRLAEARGADDILMFQAGRLVERGTHEELFVAGGPYRELWDKQSGFDVSEDGRQATVDARRLRHVALFTDLNDDALARIAGGLTSEYYEAAQTVFAEGDSGNRFYLIARGQVEVVFAGTDGLEHVLESLGDGDHFGELALLQDRPRTATIRTVSPSVLLTMGRDAFLGLVASTPEMSRLLEERMIRSELNLDEWRRLVGRTPPA